MVQWRNTWWKSDDGAKGAARNFGKRGVWSLYNILRVFCDFVVLIPFLLAITFLIIAIWLSNVSDTQQAKAIKPLNDTDHYIDEIVDGINYLTQELPIDVIEWFSGVLNKTQDSIQKLSDNAVGNTAGAINFLSKEICDVFNKAKNKVGANNVIACNIPQVTFQQPDLTGWAPVINYTIIMDKLEKLAIPSRNFSVAEEVSPFVVQFFDIPRTIATYLYILGVILAIYVGIRVFYALAYAYVPSPHVETKSKKAKCCLTFTKMTARALWRTFKQVLKPWIHIPLIIGILMMVVAAAYVDPEIDRIQIEIHTPLIKADAGILKVVNKINNFTYKAPREVNDYINEWMDIVSGAAFLGMRAILSQVNGTLYEINYFMQNTVEARINSILNSMSSGLGTVSIPTWDQSTINVNIPTQLIPHIPSPDMSKLMIDETLFSLNNAIGPWVDERVEDARKISRTIFWVGFGIMILPAISVVIAFASGYVPKKIERWLEDPGFHDEPKKKKKKKKKNTSSLV